MSYGSEELLRINVTFQYRYFKERILSTSQTSVINQALEVINNPRSFATNVLRGVGTRIITNNIPSPILRNVLSNGLNRIRL